MTRFVCISDTHNALSEIEIPDGDVLLHAGDISFNGRAPELLLFNYTMKALPHKHKVLIPGNHDFLFENDPLRARSLIDSSITILDNTGLIIDGKKIWGSPNQPIFCNWAFNFSDEILEQHWKTIPDNTDILITHTPPFGISDDVSGLGTEHVGDKFLALNVKRIKPKVHLFGHIHEGYGIQEVDNIKYINAAIMDAHYNPVNLPIVFDL